MLVRLQACLRTLFACTLITVVLAPAALASPKPQMSDQDLAFKDAYRAMNRNDKAALQAAARKIGSDYLLADYLRYWQLRLEINQANRADKQLPALDQSVRQFIAARPKSLTADLLRKKWMLTLAEREEWAELLEHFPHWIRRNDTRVFCQAGRARLALGQRVGEQAMNALNKDRDLGEECGPLAESLLEQGIVDVSTIRYRMWRALEVRDWPSVRLLGVLLGLTESGAEKSIKQPVRTLTRFKSMAQADEMPWPSQKRDALLIALVKLARAKPVDAAQWMDSLQIKLREPESQFVWAQIAASAMRDMIPEAYGYSRRAMNARVTDITRQWLARAALRQHDWQLLTHFIGQMSSKAQSSPTWQYWRARALKAEGSQFGAQALLQQISGRHHFYGELAAEELGELVSPPQSAPAPSARAISKVAKLPGFIRAQKFYDLGIRYQGNREWNFETRKMNDDQLLASARFACDSNLPERCIATAERTRHKHDFSLRFISPFRTELTEVAQSRDLDPAWVYGLIRQESRFLPTARSSAGARGLMQIMPATGRWIARKMGVNRYSKKDLFERDTNLRFGTFYLKAVYEDLQQSALLASAAYNAGPRRPRRWMSTLPRDVDGALFVEIIPFSQTRNYVKKVLLNTAYYASVFSGEPQSLKMLLGQVPLVPYSRTDIP